MTRLYLIRIALARPLILVAETLVKSAWRVANWLGTEELTQQLEPRHVELERELNRAKANLERAIQAQALRT